MFLVQIANPSLLLSEVIDCGAALGPDELWLQANMTSTGVELKAEGKWGTGKNLASAAVIGRLPGFCSHSSSTSSFRGHLMTVQTGYFSYLHITIDLEKVNWCPTEISRNWLNMQQLWQMVLGERNQCHSTDNFNRNLMIFTRNHPRALEVHWCYTITFNELLIRAHLDKA